MRPSIRKSIKRSVLTRSIGTPMGKLDVFSAEAVKVLSNYSNLSAGESQAINDFVNAEILAENWDTYDEFFLFVLGATNGVIGFKGTTGVTGS